MTFQREGPGAARASTRTEAETKTNICTAEYRDLPTDRQTDSLHVSEIAARHGLTDAQARVYAALMGLPVDRHE